MKFEEWYKKTFSVEPFESEDMETLNVQCNMREAYEAGWSARGKQQIEQDDPLRLCFKGGVDDR